MVAQVHAAKVNITNEIENNNQINEDCTDKNKEIDLLGASFENIPSVSVISEEPSPIFLNTSIEPEDAEIDNNAEKGTIIFLLKSKFQNYLFLKVKPTLNKSKQVQPQFCTNQKMCNQQPLFLWYETESFFFWFQLYPFLGRR